MIDDFDDDDDDDDDYDDDGNDSDDDDDNTDGGFPLTWGALRRGSSGEAGWLAPPLYGMNKNLMGSVWGSIRVV